MTSEVHAVEWCSCMHESGFAVESLHGTKAGAVRAMVRLANERWQHERDWRLKYGCGNGFLPLYGHSWRVRSIPVAA